MNAKQNKAMVERIRERYKIGTRVELVFTEDRHTNLKPGEQGTVSCVDDMGTVFIDWDSGSGLGMIPGVDEIRII